MKTAYTIGRTSSYDASFANDPDDNWKCEGGWIFKCLEDAEAFLQRNKDVSFDKGGFTLDDSFSIYGLELVDTWEAYVGEDPPNDERVYRLIKPAKLFKL